MGWCHKSLQLVLESCLKLTMCVGEVQSLQDAKRAVDSCKASRALKNLALVLLLHVSSSSFCSVKMNNMLQFVPHVSALRAVKSCDLDEAYGLSRCEEKMACRETLCSMGDSNK